MLRSSQTKPMATFDSMVTKVVRTTSRGRMVVAVRKIDRGTLLLCEIPTAFVDHDVGYDRTNSRRDKLGPSMLLAVQAIATMEKSESVAQSMNDLCLSCDGSAEAQANLNSAALLVNQQTTGRVGLPKCRDVLKQLQVNCFTATNGDFSHTLGIGLYLQAAAINHSCDPNACQSFHEESKALSIRATKDIQPGEEITITYIDIGKPTSWRRRELRETYGFVCMCSRCSIEDLMENSGIRCQSSCAGCPGMYQLLEHDIYRQWNSATAPSAPASFSASSTATATATATSSSVSLTGDATSTSKVEVPLPLPYMDVWQTHFQYLLQQQLLHRGSSGSTSSSGSSSSSSKNVPGKSADSTVALRFKCTSCQHIIPAVTLAEQVADMCRLVHDLKDEQRSQTNNNHNNNNNNNNNNNSTYFTKCFDLIHKLSSWMNASTNCYAMVEIYRHYLLDELLLQQRFDQYLQVIRSFDYLIHLTSCYPHKGHPIISTQAAMVAKALLFVCTSQRDVKEAHELLVSAEEHLSIAYGTDSPIVRDIQGMLSSL